MREFYSTIKNSQNHWWPLNWLETKF
jgi:hypothetical protein